MNFLISRAVNILFLTVTWTIFLFQNLFSSVQTDSTADNCEDAGGRNKSSTPQSAMKLSNYLPLWAEWLSRTIIVFLGFSTSFFSFFINLSTWVAFVLLQVVKTRCSNLLLMAPITVVDRLSVVGNLCTYGSIVKEFRILDKLIFRYRRKKKFICGLWRDS